MTVQDKNNRPAETADIFKSCQNTRRR